MYQNPCPDLERARLLQHSAKRKMFATKRWNRASNCYIKLVLWMRLLQQNSALKLTWIDHACMQAMMWLGRTDPSSRGGKIEPQTALRTAFESSRRILKQLFRQNTVIFASKKSCVANFWYQFWAETGLAQNLVPNRRSRIQTKHMETRNLHVAKFFYTTACLG